MLALIIIIVIVVIFGGGLVGIYNSLVQLNIKVQEAWSGITVQLKRRADLIPNLVNTVKGYATHEKSVFENVTNARAQTISASGPAEAAKAEGAMQQALKSLFAVAEAYPDLKASQNFQELQTQITDTEDKIQASRRFYNANVTAFNTKRKVFPTNLVAGMFGYSTDKEFFDVDEAEATAIQKPVDVQF